jgi:hypothetical protein
MPNWFMQKPQKIRLIAMSLELPTKVPVRCNSMLQILFAVSVLQIKKKKHAVWFHMELFHIERGFYSRTDIGEREMVGKTACT